MIHQCSPFSQIVPIPSILHLLLIFQLNDDCKASFSHQSAPVSVALLLPGRCTTANHTTCSPFKSKNPERKLPHLRSSVIHTNQISIIKIHEWQSISELQPRSLEQCISQITLERLSETKSGRISGRRILAKNWRVLDSATEETLTRFRNLPPPEPQGFIDQGSSASSDDEETFLRYTVLRGSTS